MTKKMFARYPGVCSKCGKKILVGEEILWDTDTRKAEHRVCPTWRNEEPKIDAPYSIGGGSGYGYSEYRVGQIVRSSDKRIAEGWPEYLFVVKASRSYISEDGMSFGVGDESGYIYSAKCRAATESEAAEAKASREKAMAKKAAKTRVTEIARMIQDTGERPQADPIGPNDKGYREDYRPGFILQGERLLDTATIYGTGDWFVIAEDHIWYVRNNGSDGDAWDLNNISTGGAGGIGWRIPLNPALAEELRKLHQTLI